MNNLVLGFDDRGLPMPDPMSSDEDEKITHRIENDRETILLLFCENKE